MAITKQDYRYVHNTLNKTQNYQGDNELKIGVKVSNLLPSMTDENIFNRSYSNYYGMAEQRTGWEPQMVVEESDDEYATDSEYEYVSDFVWQVEEKHTVDAHYQAPAISFSHRPYQITDVVVYNQKGLLVQTKALFSNSTLKWIITFNNSESVADNEICTVYYKIKKWKVKVPTYESNKVVGNAILQSCKILNSYSSPCEFCGVDDNKLVFEFEHGNYDTYDEIENKPVLSYYVEYFISHQNGVMVDSLMTGNLTSKVILKPNTSYIIQVINNAEVGASSYIKINDKLLNFEKSLYFNTTDLINDSTECSVVITGASYGYQILHKDVGGIVWDLRPVKTSTQAKVYLFEANAPWVVDTNGVIVGIDTIPLYLYQTQSNEGFRHSLSIDFIKKAFSTPPVMKRSINGDELIIDIPQAVFINSMIEENLVDEDAIKFLKELRLVVYRNYLVESEQKHNKQFHKKQYCKIRPICTNGDRISGVGQLKAISYNQTENNELITKTNNSINIAPIYLTERNSERPLLKTEIKFTHKTASEVKRFRFNAETGEYVVNYNEIPLGALCLLGYNRQHMLNKNLVSNYKRYTSVSFAWGATAEDHIDPNQPQYSIPLIIDRKVISSISEDITGSNAQEFTTKINFRTDVEFSTLYTDTSYYTKTAAVYLKITTTGGGSNNPDKPVIKPGFDIVEHE